jgi:hypothetical protein
MSVYQALDAISAKAKTITGILESYTATGSGVAASGAPIPESLDFKDGAVTVTWIGAGELKAGNLEELVFYPRLFVWVRATNAGYAFKTLAAFPDLVIAAFRDGITFGGTVTECKCTGWEEPTPETMNNGQVYLVLPFTFRVLILNPNTLYTA